MNVGIQSARYSKLAVFHPLSHLPHGPIVRLINAGADDDLAVVLSTTLPENLSSFFAFAGKSTVTGSTPATVTTWFGPCNEQSIRRALSTIDSSLGHRFSSYRVSFGARYGAAFHGIIEQL